MKLVISNVVNSSRRKSTAFNSIATVNLGTLKTQPDPVRELKSNRIFSSISFVKHCWKTYFWKDFFKTISKSAKMIWGAIYPAYLNLYATLTDTNSILCQNSQNWPFSIFYCCFHSSNVKCSRSIKIPFYRALL